MSRVFGGCRALMAKASKAGGSKDAAVSTTSTAGKAALTRPWPLSPAMKRFLGVPEISRPLAVKKIWEHIKANQLQNPANKREIRCDEKLKSIFGDKEKVGMLEIGKLISPHFLKSN